MGIDKEISKEEWIELSKKLRNRFVPISMPTNLKPLASLSSLPVKVASFDQINQ